MNSKNSVERSSSQLPIILSVTGTLPDAITLPATSKDQQIFGYFERQQVSIFGKSIQWEAYKNAELITDEELNVLRELNRRIPSNLQSFTSEDTKVLSILFRILKDLKNEAPMEFSLAILVEMIRHSSQYKIEWRNAYNDYASILFK
jgi:hypothetical protein